LIPILGKGEWSTSHYSLLYPRGIRREYPHSGRKEEDTKVDQTAGGLIEKMSKILKFSVWWEKAFERESWETLVQDTMTQIGF
jgi:hypothetical protein